MADDSVLSMEHVRSMIIHGLPARGDMHGASAVQLTALRVHWKVLRSSSASEGEVGRGERLSLLERLYRRLDHRLFGRGKWAALTDSGPIECSSHDSSGPTDAVQLHLAWRREVLDAGDVDRLCIEYEGLPMAELEQAVRGRLGQPGGMLCVRVWLLGSSHAPRLLVDGRLRLDHRSLWRSIAVCAAKLPAMLRAAEARRDRPALAPAALEVQATGSLSAARQIWRLALESLAWALYREQWRLELGQTQGDVCRPVATTARLRPPGSAFWADPFLLRRGSRTWVLFEELPFDTNRGHICAVEVDSSGRALAKPQVVLQEPWHLSYPFLWHEEGRDYMIPESAASRQLALYEFAGEGRQWRRRATLISGLRLADATIARHGGRLWMFATCGDEGTFMDDTLHAYWAHRIEGPWFAHSLNPVKIDASSARPAGSMWVADGVLHRVVQDCSSTYGGRARCMRIIRLTPEEFEEEPVSDWVPPEFKSSEPWHTFNAVANLTVIDRLVRTPSWRR